MQPTQMHPGSRRWLQWIPPLFWGVILACLEILLLSQAEKIQNWSASSWPAFALSALLYLLIPGVEGYLAAWQSKNAASGVKAGCLVGAMSFLVIGIIAAVALVVVLTTPPPVCPPDCPRFYLPVSFVAPIVFTFYVGVAGFGGAVGGLLGGWIGGLLAQRKAHL